MKIVDKRTTFTVLVTLLALTGVFLFQNSYALPTNVPTIVSFAKSTAEDNALKVTLKSNNTGSDFSLEVLNITKETRVNLAGSITSYTFQNLESGKEYEVMVRACSNSNNEYKCTEYSPSKKATSGVKGSTPSTPVKPSTPKVNTPTLLSVTSPSTTSIKLKYKTSGNVTGVEIYNNTLKKTYKTTNKSTFTNTGLKSGTKYSYKIRTYYIYQGKTYKSAYTTSKTSITKKPVVNTDTILGPKSYSKKIDSPAFTLNARSKAGNKLYYKSSNSNIIYVTSTGKVYVNDIGTAYITVYTNKKGTIPAVSTKITIAVARRTTKPIIGEASSGNNGLGDQSGREVSLGSWYTNGSFANWDHLYRFKDPIKAEKAAQFMIATCKNNKIGYDNRTKSKSMSFTYELRKVGWDPSKIKNKCATACSQCVLTIVQATGLHRNSINYPYKDARRGGNALGNDSNFRTFTDKSYTKDYKKLKPGDILADTSSDGRRHMLMVVK